MVCGKKCNAGVEFQTFLEQFWVFCRGQHSCCPYMNPNFLDGNVGTCVSRPKTKFTAFSDYVPISTEAQRNGENNDI